MNDTRFQLVELKLTEHDKMHLEAHRRLSDHADILKGHGSLLGYHAEQLKSQEALIATQKRMIEVGENLIQALGWVGGIAKWIVALTAAGVALKTVIVAIMHMGKA